MQRNNLNYYSLCFFVVLSDQSTINARREHLAQVQQICPRQCGLIWRHSKEASDSKLISGNLTSGLTKRNFETTNISEDVP